MNRFLGLSKDDPRFRVDGRLMPSRKRIQLPEMSVGFALTLLGGGAWETCANPDWSGVILESRGSSDGVLISPNRDRLIAYMGWYAEINQEQIELDTIDLSVRADFPILYWKRLPLVYRAAFRLQPAKERWIGRPPQWFRDWHIATMSWYRRPWELAGWPQDANSSPGHES